MQFSNSLSRADQLDLYDLTDKNVGLSFTGDPLFVDLTALGFSIVQRKGKVDVKTFSIAAGVASNSYMTKTGNVLYIGPILTEIFPVVLVSKDYRLIVNCIYADGSSVTLREIAVYGHRY